MDSTSRRMKTRLGFLGVIILCLVVMVATVSALVLKNTSELDIGLEAYSSEGEIGIIDLQKESLFQTELVKENIYTRYIKIENTGTEKGSYQIILTEDESVLEEFMKYCITAVKGFDMNEPISGDFGSLNQSVSKSVLLEPGEKQLYRIDIILDDEEFENYIYSSLGFVIAETRENWSNHLIIEGKENEKPTPLETSVKPLPDDIWENDTFVTGQGVAGALIEITIKDKYGEVVFQETTHVDATGEWAINCSPFRVALTCEVVVTQTEVGKLTSEGVFVIIQPGG